MVGKVTAAKGKRGQVQSASSQREQFEGLFAQAKKARFEDKQDGDDLGSTCSLTSTTLGSSGSQSTWACPSPSSLSSLPSATTPRIDDASVASATKVCEELYNSELEKGTAQVVKPVPSSQCRETEQLAGHLRRQQLKNLKLKMQHNSQTGERKT